MSKLLPIAIVLSRPLSERLLRWILLIGFKNILILAAYELYFVYRYRKKLSSYFFYIDIKNLGFKSKNRSSGYSMSPYYFISGAFGELNRILSGRKRLRFVDIGSGAGRVLWVAQKELNVDHIVGVEADGELFESSKINLNIGELMIEVKNEHALIFAYKKDSIFFLYETLKCPRAIRRLAAVLARQGGSFLVLMHNNSTDYVAVFEKHGFMRVSQKLMGSSVGYSILQTADHMGPPAYSEKPAFLPSS